MLGLVAMREVGTFRGQASSCVASTEFGLLQGLASWGIPSAGREVGCPSLQVGRDWQECHRIPHPESQVPCFAHWAMMVVRGAARAEKPVLSKLGSLTVKS